MIYHLPAAEDMAKYIFVWMVAVEILLLYVHIQDGIKAPEETEVNNSDLKMLGEFTHFSEYF